MSKAIFSLFCVAALFSPGLVLASPTTGDVVEEIVNTVGDASLLADLDPNRITYYCKEDLCNVKKSIEEAIKDKESMATGNQGAQANTGPRFVKNNLEDQLLAAAGDVLDNLIDLGENAKVLKRLTQAINN